MQKQQEELNMGVLDIYGFEIFQVSTHICTVLITLNTNLNPKVFTPTLRRDRTNNDGHILTSSQ